MFADVSNCLTFRLCAFWLYICIDCLVVVEEGEEVLDSLLFSSGVNFWFCCSNFNLHYVQFYALNGSIHVYLLHTSFLILRETCIFSPKQYFIDFLAYFFFSLYCISITQ